MPPSLRSLCCLITLLSSVFTCRGHVVEQLFFILEKAGPQWEVTSAFDAGYALPKFRDDASSPQPPRSWLTGLSEKEHQALRTEAETYLRESMLFSYGDQTADFTVSFPDFANRPPSFPTMLNGGAYFNISLRGNIEIQQGQALKLTIAQGDRPNFIIASGPQSKRQYRILKPGESVELFTLDPSGNEHIPQHTGNLDWIRLGYQHVLPDGWDHALFILALFLMARRWQALLAQSLCFTIAHCITLGLASSHAMAIQQWPGAWLIEPLIALSIAAVAIENLFTDQQSKRRLVTVFLFGLIHGLGFAGSLGTLLNPSGENGIRSLVLANIGVELAQVTLLLIAWILTTSWHTSKIYPRFRAIASAGISLIALFWFVDRLWSSHPF
ncbi:HupE/UreJ family protein [Verrucomicrobiaceae bacterium N1E253]|uniref:HupE/UreJ family protein n=1 Tax=Oceaniferula marina TaxID=2748318 RepID=A0A851GQT0_9BACT|nr:HupE/UreJ family protein [Oceaniferula marina]NWK57170.1 HupE/UreJ family protein [Oceaniferula marina]